MVLANSKLEDLQDLYNKYKDEFEIKGEEFINLIAKDFGYLYMGQEYGGLPADRDFENAWDFINYLFEHKLEQGHYFFKIDGQVYHIFCP